MKVDLRELTVLCEMTERPQVTPWEILALIRVARAAKAFNDCRSWPKKDELRHALHAALSDIEDSER